MSRYSSISLVINITILYRPSFCARSWCFICILWWKKRPRRIDPKVPHHGGGVVANREPGSYIQCLGYVTAFQKTTPKTSPNTRTHPRYLPQNSSISWPLGSSGRWGMSVHVVMIILSVTALYWEYTYNKANWKAVTSNMVTPSLYEDN